MHLLQNLLLQIELTHVIYSVCNDKFAQKISLPTHYVTTHIGPSVVELFDILHFGFSAADHKF